MLWLFVFILYEYHSVTIFLDNRATRHQTVGIGANTIFISNTICAYYALFHIFVYIYR